MQPKNGKFPLLILNRKQMCLFLTDLRLLFDLGLNMALVTPRARSRSPSLGGYSQYRVVCCFSYSGSDWIKTMQYKKSLPEEPSKSYFLSRTVYRTYLYCWEAGNTKMQK